MKNVMLRFRVFVVAAAFACGLSAIMPTRAHAVIPGYGVVGSAYFEYEDDGNVYACELSFCYGSCYYNCYYTGMTAI
jgi:hypothetical protein